MTRAPRSRSAGSLCNHERRDHGNGLFGAPIDFAEEPIQTSIALGDLNADGKLDVVAGNRSYNCTDSVSVLLNTSP